MKVAFALSGRGFFGRAISFWTRSKYSHVEIIFENPISIAFSSDEESGGTRFKNIIDLVDDKKWLVLPVPYLTVIDETRVFDFVKTNLLGLGYNWLDIASFIFHNLDPENPKRYICSAVCLLVLQQIPLFKGLRTGDCSPELLFELVSSIQVNAPDKH